MKLGEKNIKKNNHIKNRIKPTFWKNLVIVILTTIILVQLCSCDSNNESLTSIFNFFSSFAESEEQKKSEVDVMDKAVNNSNIDNNYESILLGNIIEENDAIDVVNNNCPSFTDEEKSRTDLFELYSELDELGRCGVAYANICKESMPTESRGEIGSIKPSGWHTVKYSDIIEDRYLYNRCHLIGYQLAGENDNEKNLITGTRYLNINCMLPFENLIKSYVDRTNNHVLFRVSPVFNGDDLVANYVSMEAWSVEDEGEGVCFNVRCKNIQPGITIDYSNGESCVQEDYVAQSECEETEYDYIINLNSQKFHLPLCESVSNMSEHNKKGYNGTYEELIGFGYFPCKRCIDY